MKIDFSKLFDAQNDGNNKTLLISLEKFINSKGLIFEDFEVAIFLSVYCLRCIDLLPGLKKEEDTLRENGYLIIFESTNEEMQSIIAHFNLRIPIINSDLDFLVNELKINKTPSYIAWNNNEGIIVESRSIDNITDLKILGKIQR